MESKRWALILGGSKGLGLATAKKLAQNGYALIVVHRDGKAEMREISPEFEEISSKGTPLLSFNADATQQEKRIELIQKIKDHLPK